MYFVSPDIRRYKSLQKSGQAMRICQPHYRRDEMLCVAPFAMPDSDDVTRERKVDEVMERFDGNIRALFGSHDFWLSVCIRQDQEINNSVVTGVVKTLSDVQKLPELSHTLIKLQPDREGYSMQLLSPYVQDRLVFHMRVEHWWQLKKLLQFSSKQNELEVICQALIPPGGEFKAKSLHSSKKTMDLPKLEVTHRFYSLDEIYESEEVKGVYWLPRKTNFPAADAISSLDGRFTVFEITSLEDGSRTINYEGAWNLLKELGFISPTGPLNEKRIKHRLTYVFVVPPRNFDVFTLPKKFKTPKKKKPDYEKKLRILDLAFEQWVITCDALDGF